MSMLRYGALLRDGIAKDALYFAGAAQSFPPEFGEAGFGLYPLSLDVVSGHSTDNVIGHFRFPTVHFLSIIESMG